MFTARYVRLLPPTTLGVLLSLASSLTAAAQASPAASPSPPPRDEQARPLVKGRHGAVVSLHPLASHRPSALQSKCQTPASCGSVARNSPESAA